MKYTPQPITCREDVVDYIEKYFVDSHGIVRSAVSLDGGRRLTDEDCSGQLQFPESEATVRELYEYENSGMATGAYFMSQILDWELNQNPAALQRMRRCYRSIKYVLELGKQLEYGFYPKPWGGRFTHGTSTDQVLYTMFALDAYYPHAEAAEQAEIPGILEAMIEFWRKRDYKFTFLNMKDMKWPPLRFPSLLYLAGHYTNRDDLRKEADLLVEQNLHNMPENSKLYKERPLNDYEKANNIKIVYGLPDSTTMATMNSLLMYYYGPKSLQSKLADDIRLMWDEGKRVLAEDGTAYTSMYLDLTTNELKSAIDPKYKYYFNGARTGWSTMIIRAALQALETCPDLKDEVLAQAEKTLSTFTSAQRFTYIEPEDEYLLESKYHYKAKLISGDSIANYAWSAYLMQKYSTR